MHGWVNVCSLPGHCITGKGVGAVVKWLGFNAVFIWFTGCFSGFLLLETSVFSFIKWKKLALMIQEIPCYRLMSFDNDWHCGAVESM